jgi:hypothetical protein
MMISSMEVVVVDSVVVVVGSVVVVDSVVVVVGCVVVVVGGGSVGVGVDGTGGGLVVRVPAAGEDVGDDARAGGRPGTVVPTRATGASGIRPRPVTPPPSVLVARGRTVSTLSSSVSGSAAGVVPAPDAPPPSASPGSPDGEYAGAASAGGSSTDPTSTSVGPVSRPSTINVKPMAAAKITAARSASPIHPGGLVLVMPVASGLTRAITAHRCDERITPCGS